MYSPVRMCGGGPGQQQVIVFNEWRKAQDYLEGNNYNSFTAGKVKVEKPLYFQFYPIVKCFAHTLAHSAFKKGTASRDFLYSFFSSISSFWSY